MQQRHKQKLGILVGAAALGMVLPNYMHTHSNAGMVLGAFTQRVPDRGVTDMPENASVQLIDAVATVPQRQALSVRQISYPQAPDFGAKSILVYDPRSGTVVFSKDPSQKLEIASLTKLMTAVVASESPDFGKPLTITAGDLVNVSPALHLKAGDSVRPQDLLNAMLIGSANDAAEALAAHLPGREAFIKAMNEKAAQLGMASTHFTTPIGFDDPQNYSTASDLRILVDYALTHLPYENLWQAQSYSFTSISGVKYAVRTSNSLLPKHANIRSIKTGQTVGALGNMIVLADNDSGNEIISIVLGSPNRNADTLKAVDYVFQNFSWR